MARRGATAAICILLVTSTAAAQPPPVTLAGTPSPPAHDPAAAETLFKSAKALLDQGDWAGACVKLRASMELDPAVSTLLKIAHCHDHEGKLAAAWSDVTEAVKLNRALPQPEQRRKDLEDYGVKLLAELDKRLPKLRLRAATAPPEVRVTFDGRPLPAAVLGEALPVDPGPHEIGAEAPGFTPFHTSVTLAEGQSIDVDLVLTPVAPESLRPLVAIPTPGPAGADDPGTARRAAGIGVGTPGVASLGGALALAILTLRGVAAAKPHCSANFSSCDSQGIDQLEQAQSLQTGAFVLLGVGLAATATGIALFATAPRATATPPPAAALSAVVGPLGARVRATW